ncbi:MAG: helix-turn-helix transcriptional regulator [Euryarchaeota archaeon]|nr:helix-turn-helix transcriptional regulator [Euryarchaeota archaeon]
MSEEPENGDIFQMLSHPYRKEIIRLVSRRPMMYTELMEGLGIESGKLRFHLEKVRPLLQQDKHKKYVLSEQGKKALVFLESAERLEVPVERETDREQLVLAGAIFLVIGFVGGFLISQSLPGSGDVENKEPLNVTREAKPLFLPEFEVGVYGIPEVLAANESKVGRIDVRNMGDVTVKNLTFRLKVVPGDGFVIGNIKGKGIEVEEAGDGVYVFLDNLYTNPEITKSFEFTMRTMDSKIDHTLVVEVFFYPREEWVTVYEQEIYVAPPKIIIR